MNYLLEAFAAALQMLVALDRELFAIVLVSVKVSAASTLLATLIGIPIGFGLAMTEFWGKRMVVSVLNTLMAMPTVVVGLLIYGLLSRRGPMGDLALLYTPWAMILGQTVLIIPIIGALSLSAIHAVDSRVEKTALTLGASQRQAARMILSEGRYALLAAVTAGFGRVFAEVGISMMLGGNIRGYTRNITTAIALETGKGEFALGIALGIVLLTVAFGINVLFHLFQQPNE